MSEAIPISRILAPFLFCIFHKPNHISKCTISLYIDDIFIIRAGKTAEEAQISLPRDLKCVLQWLKANRLHLNIKKTKFWHILEIQKSNNN